MKYNKYCSLFFKRLLTAGLILGLGLGQSLAVPIMMASAEELSEGDSSDDGGDTSGGDTSGEEGDSSGTGEGETGSPEETEPETQETSETENNAGESTGETDTGRRETDADTEETSETSDAGSETDTAEETEETEERDNEEDPEFDLIGEEETEDEETEDIQIPGQVYHYSDAAVTFRKVAYPQVEAWCYLVSQSWSADNAGIRTTDSDETDAYAVSEYQAAAIMAAIETLGAWDPWQLDNGSGDTLSTSEKMAFADSIDAGMSDGSSLDDFLNSESYGASAEDGTAGSFAYGLLQWSDEADKKALYAYCSAHDCSIGSLTGQLGFILASIDEASDFYSSGGKGFYSSVSSPYRAAVSLLKGWCGVTNAKLLDAAGEAAEQIYEVYQGANRMNLTGTEDGVKTDMTRSLYQMDSKYRDQAAGIDISASACSTTALSSINYAATGEDRLELITRDAVSRGYLISDGMSRAGLVSLLASYGYSSVYSSGYVAAGSGLLSGDTIRTYFSNYGKLCESGRDAYMILLVWGPHLGCASTFTRNSGHFIAVTNYKVGDDGQQYFYVRNPNGRSEGWQSVSTFCNLTAVIYTFEGHFEANTYTPSASKTQTIDAASEYILFEREAGDTMSLGIGTTGDGKLSYGGGDTAIATVDKTGTVTMHGIGETTITVSASAGDYYSAAGPVEITIRVVPDPETIQPVSLQLPQFPQLR